MRWGRTLGWPTHREAFGESRGEDNDAGEIDGAHFTYAEEDVNRLLVEIVVEELVEEWHALGERERDEEEHPRQPPLLLFEEERRVDDKGSEEEDGSEVGVAVEVRRVEAIVDAWDVRADDEANNTTMVTVCER